MVACSNCHYLEVESETVDKLQKEIQSLSTVLDSMTKETEDKTFINVFFLYSGKP